MNNESPGDTAKRTLYWACLITALLALLPTIIGALTAARTGDWYTGFQHSFDDQMVYSAWMTQAQDGHLLMDNRFAVDPQPVLTVQLYFFALGLVSKLLGIPLTAALARAAFSVLFVVLLYRFLGRLTPNTYFRKLGLCLGVFGGGLGFLVWHNFGKDFSTQANGPASGLLGGHLPIDVWQPEAFVFPSMLTNGLFMASLCLMLVVMECLLEARHSWRPVLPGALAMLALMNIHSYDVLLIAMVAVAFLSVQVANRDISFAWALRGLAIGAGALPSAAWFLFVLAKDPVFQARAATPTFAPTFRQVIGGLVLLIAFASLHWLKQAAGAKRRSINLAGLALFVLAGVVGFCFGTTGDSEFWVGLPGWAGLYVVVIALAILLRSDDSTQNLVQSWALVGLAAVYFPGLFQRKLAMGMALPWSILAALGIFSVLEQKAKEVRIAVGALSLTGLCLTSACWFLRERAYVTSNVSRTTMQPAFFQPEIRKILEVLRNQPGRKVVLAIPGVNAEVAPDTFEAPLIADLNPLASGFAGAYTYAGHWSETPDYLARRSESVAFFLKATGDGARAEIIRRSGAEFVIAPVPESLPELLRRDLFDARALGDVLAGGTQFVLIRLR